MAYRNEFRPNGINTHETQVHAYFAKYNYRLYIYIYIIYIYIYIICISVTECVLTSQTADKYNLFYADKEKATRVNHVNAWQFVIG